MTTRGKISRAGLALALAAVLGACGGDDDAADGAAPDASSDAADVDDTDGDVGDSEAADVGDEVAADGSSGINLTHSGGTATVTLDGYGTYEFATVDGAINVCTNLFGSFQVALPMVDETGAHVDGSEINMELIEPGSGADTQGENTPALEIIVPEGNFAAGDSGLASIMEIDTPALELTPSSKLTASGTVTVLDMFERTTVEATIDVSCE